VSNVFALPHRSIVSRPNDHPGVRACIMTVSSRSFWSAPRSTGAAQPREGRKSTCRRRPVMNRLLALAVTLLVVAPALAQDKPAAKTPTAVITLEKGGQITLEFFPADAPKHVENFLKLARAGFYDGQRFHRVEPGFVVQLGDPQSKTLPMAHSSMGAGGPGYSIKAEFNNRKFDRGMLGMARSQHP